MAASTMKKRVQDAVHNLDFEELKEKWLQEMVAKVKGELTASSAAGDDSDATTFEDDDPLDLPTATSPPAAPVTPYQATAEDEFPSSQPIMINNQIPQQPCGNNAHPPTPAPSSPASSASLFSVSSRASASDDIAISSVKADPQVKIVSSPPPSPVTEQRPSVHFKSRPTTVLHSQRNDAATHNRPGSPPLGSRDNEILTHGQSSVDQQWGRLFANTGEPMKRLSQLLQGIASSILAENPPAIVLTPPLLHNFYSRFTSRLDNQGGSLAFAALFSTPASHGALRRIELLYQDFQCEYHLVQEHPRAQPVVPGLTPLGFQRWLTLLIAAFPDAEADRLARVVAALPVEAKNEAGNTERLPTQLPRRLFPERSSDAVREFVVSCVRRCQNSDSRSRSASLQDTGLHVHRNVIRQHANGGLSGDEQRNPPASRYSHPSRERAYMVQQPAAHSRNASKKGYHRYEAEDRRNSSPLPRSSSRHRSGRFPHDRKYCRQPSPDPSRRHRNNTDADAAPRRRSSLSTPRGGSPQREARLDDVYRRSQGRERRGSVDGARDAGRQRRLR